MIHVSYERDYIDISDEVCIRKTSQPGKWAEDCWDFKYKPCGYVRVVSKNCKETSLSCAGCGGLHYIQCSVWKKFKFITGGV